MHSIPSSRPSVRALTDRPVADVVIIGGGINGAAMFRDLALQGVDVVLVERGDFCSGASAASSHMIHGGIRYLENGEFRLVREALAERNDLLRTAPHFVTPLRTTIPLSSTFGGLLAAVKRFLTHRPTTGSRGAILVKAGLMMYDAFAQRRSGMPGHRFRRRSTTRGEFAEGVRFLASYFDAAVREPERLAVDILVESSRRGPRARAVNHVGVVGRAGAETVLRDQISGLEFTVAARVVVNATGPWVDETNRILGQDTAYMGGTRGSHIILDNPDLLAAAGGDEIFFEHEDGRIVLLHPLKDLVMVGTSDIPHDIREPARCTDEELDYFVGLVRHVFPRIAVDATQVVFAFSGVRPLPRADGIRPGFVSRDYRLESARDEGVLTLSVIGGKWTTFRALAESVADAVLTELGRQRAISTRSLPIGGGSGFPATAEERQRWIDARQTTVDAPRAHVLLTRYGTRADELIARFAADPDVPLTALPSWSGAELRWLVDQEFVAGLDDLILRRTDIAFVGDATRVVLGEVAENIAGLLGWDEDRSAREVEFVLTQISDGLPPAARQARHLAGRR